MAGIRALRKIQMGPETTAGTAVAATSYWRGVGTIQDIEEVVFVEEDIGLLSGSDRTYIPRVEALLNLEPTEATFEQLPYLFQMGIEEVSPTTDASGDGIFSYVMSIQSTDINTSTDLGTYTFEAGDNQQAEEFAYGYCRSITLSGDAGQGLMMSGEIVGRQASNTTFTAGLTIPTVEDILFSKGKLYIDAVGGTIGSTQVSNSFLTMNLSINTGWMPVYTADGNIYFSFVKQTMPEVILQVTFEHDANSVIEKGYWRDQTARQIRVKFDGSDASKYLTLDMAGKWENFEPIGERNGNDILSGTFRARYNSTAALFFEAVIGTGLASLP